MSITDRVVGLIGLAGSDNANEARNAAHAACALIRKHGLKFGGQPSNARVSDEYWRLRALRAEGELSALKAQQVRPQERKPAESEHPPMVNWVRLSSKYNGFCAVCRQPYAPGDLIWWRKGSGSRHPACHTRE